MSEYEKYVQALEYAHWKARSELISHDHIDFIEEQKLNQQKKEK